MASQTPDGTSAASRRITKTRVLWAVQILLALFMIFAAAMPKLFGNQTEVDAFDDIGWGQWFRYFTGVVELAGGVGLLVPRLSAPAAAGLVGVMVGAVIANVGPLDMPEVVPFPVVLGVLFALIAWNRREQARPLLDLLKR